MKKTWFFLVSAITLFIGACATQTVSDKDSLQTPATNKGKYYLDDGPPADVEIALPTYRTPRPEQKKSIRHTIALTPHWGKVLSPINNCARIGKKVLPRGMVAVITVAKHHRAKFMICSK